MKALLSSEFLKLKTVRTGWALLAAVMAITALPVSASIAGVGPVNIDLQSDDGVRAVLHVVGSGAIFVLMLGIIIVAGEYRQGTAIDTFLTTPGRTRVLMAKFLMSMSAGVVFGAVATVVAIVTAIIGYQVKGVSLPLGSGTAWSIMAGAVIYAALFGSLGASIGSLIRNQVVAIIAAFALIIVAEPMIMVISPGIGKWLPAALGRALVSDPGGDFLSPALSGVLLLAYAVAIMAVAAIIERRRDA